MLGSRIKFGGHPDFQKINDFRPGFIQDWGMNIRHLENPDLLKGLRDQWVIYRVYPPCIEGNLWHDFQKGLGRRKSSPASRGYPQAEYIDQQRLVVGTNHPGHPQ